MNNSNNLFAEPQYSVARHGIVPQWRVFMGLNYQFSLTQKDSEKGYQDRTCGSNALAGVCLARLFTGNGLFCKPPPPRP